MAREGFNLVRAATRWAALCVATLALCGCEAARPAADIGVSRLSQQQSLVCTEAVLSGHPLQITRLHVTEGWRLDLQVLSGAPLGLLDKGAVLHDGHTLAYLPLGATEGLADDVVEAAVTAALRACR